MTPEKQKYAIAIWRSAKTHPNHDMEDRDEGRYFQCTRCAAYQNWKDFRKDGELKGPCIEDRNSYTDDLGAMQEAEQHLPESKRGYYNTELSKVVLNRDLSSALKEPDFIFKLITASPAHRAEALLRTIGKYEH